MTGRGGCHWCSRARPEAGHDGDDAPFVLLEHEPLGGSGGFTLVPKEHVKVLTELAPKDMAAVLAGLQRASARLRQDMAPCEVEIRVFPRAMHPTSGHLHFYLVPQPGAGEPASTFSGSVFASLDDAVSH